MSRMIAVLLPVFLASSVFSMDRLTEKRFVEAVELETEDVVEQVKFMNGRKYWMAGYAYLRKVGDRDEVRVRPLGVDADIQVTFCCGDFEAQIRKSLRGKTRTKILFSGTANTNYEKDAISPDYKQPYMFSDFRRAEFMEKEELEAARWEDAVKQKQIIKVPTTRLWAFTNIKRVVIQGLR